MFINRPHTHTLPNHRPTKLLTPAHPPIHPAHINLTHPHTRHLTSVQKVPQWLTAARVWCTVCTKHNLSVVEEAYRPVLVRAVGINCPSRQPLPIPRVLCQTASPRAATANFASTSGYFCRCCCCYSFPDECSSVSLSLISPYAFSRLIFRIGLLYII